jgi:hypothetical protein
VVASARIPAPAACRATVNALIADLQPHELEVFMRFFAQLGANQPQRVK